MELRLAVAARAPIQRQVSRAKLYELVARAIFKG